MYSNRPKRLQFLRSYVDDASIRSESKYIDKDTSEPLIQQALRCANSSSVPSLDPCSQEHSSVVTNEPILDNTGESLGMLLQDNVPKNAAYYNTESNTKININGNDKDASTPIVQHISALIQQDSSSVNSSSALSLIPCLQEFSEIINPILVDTGESIGMLLQDNVTKNAAYHNIELDTIIKNNGNDEDASAPIVQPITAPLIQQDLSSVNSSSPLSLNPCLQEQFSDIINDSILVNTGKSSAIDNNMLHLKHNKIFADEPSTSERIWNKNYIMMEDSDDSVKDKLYEKESSDSSSEGEPISTDLKLQKRKIENDKSKNKKIKFKNMHFSQDSDNIHINENNTIGNSKRIQKGETRLVRNERKTKRNLGDQYLTKTNKIIPQRKCRDLHECRLKCSKRLEDEVRKTILNEYWSMGSFNKRVAYIATLVSTREKETTRAKKTDKKHKNRSVSHTYHLRINGQLTKVCKKCFLLTFDESNKFLTNVIKKKEYSLSGITLEDRRGKGVPYNKTSEEALDLVKNHVSALPSYKSHYCRKQTENKFLPSHYTLTRIYEEYKKWIPETMTPVSRRIYEDVFRSMKIKIKNPKKDNCAKCDKIHMQHKNTSDTVKKQTFENDLNKHQTDAKYAYESKKKDIQEALHDKSKSVFTFDLQQFLPLLIFKRQSFL
ncbi:unnamed protein product [Psylliodes chrysocephalus]|uniref:Uncharacterized protein n=1 Tax=Psylliodes chrysocephalus TaxID=3402493 RepID=A0A9P0D5I6_9CUCU|nr:unnamed protein product [Psylliodes chrysocephala]